MTRYKLVQSQHGSWWIYRHFFAFIWLPVCVRTPLRRAVETLEEIESDEL
jgi:hypothetical protein